MRIIDLLKESALSFAKSLNWKPYDGLIELDCHLPDQFRMWIQEEYYTLGNIAISMDELATLKQDVKFGALRLPENILMHFIPDQDQFSISLTKKEPELKFPDMRVVRDEDGLNPRSKEKLDAVWKSLKGRA